VKTLLAVAAGAAALVLGLAACAGPSANVPVTAGEEEAARLYRTRCASCHRLRSPSQFTREEWRVNLDKMQQRAHLTVDDRRAIERYLDAHAKDAAPAS